MKKIFKNKGNFYHLPFATILIFGLIFIYSCSKEESKDISNTTVELRSLKSGSLVNSSRLNQDADFNNLARVVSIGVEKNKSFRKLLKQQALIQFDGDYDVLVSTIKDEQLITLSGSISVKSFLGNIYQSINASIATESNDGVFNTENDPNTGDPVISSPDDIIEYIISVYPIIQISIPVLAEEWDENIHIPVVTFIPEDYNEGVTDYFEGYLNDNPIAVDAVIPPNEPVLVISLNERFHGGSSIVAAPDVDITLSATTSPIGISLSWSVSNPNDDEIMGYRIYRKTLFSNSFEIVHDNIGKENTIYNDNNVDALLSYFYYVKAYNAMGESESSNIAQANAPDVPNAVADFSALHLIADEMELRWTHETGQFIDNTTLFKRVIGVDASYQQIG
ncbi:MAG: fibronectin type III domain-containing protein, partial [Saprospiraceae bacterium]